MAEQESVAAEEASAKKKFPIVAIVVAVCVIAGGAAGVFVLAPMLVGGSAKAAVVAEEGESSGGRAGRETTPTLYSIDNIVLNPNGTNGTRFLMVSATFELADPKMPEQLRARDAEIRDILIRTFGSRTVDELADLQHREQLREDVRIAVEERLQRGAIRRVYLPQFVIQ